MSLWDTFVIFISAEKKALPTTCGSMRRKKRLFSKLQDKKSVTKVFDELSKRYSSRKGGYSRVLKAGFRTGDDAPMAVIELVDRNPEAKKIDKPKKKEATKKDKETLPKVASK